MTDETDAGLSAIRAAVDAAAEVTVALPVTGGDAAPQRDGDGVVGAGDVTLPPSCPVEPVGIKGEFYYYLDASRQLREVKGRDHSRLGVLTLFGGRIEALYTFWPRINADGVVTGWRPEKASETLMAAAAKRGVWDPLERVRGPGAWPGDDGGLVLHCGDRIWHNGGFTAPGILGRHVYPAAPPSPVPANRLATDCLDDVLELFDLLKSWAWQRGETDAHLLLGWIAAAMIGGALDWRPLAWITGDKATGKSTLHKLLQLLFDGELIHTSDASAAGIWQRVAHSTAPVAFDELEASEDNRGAQNVIRLARQAASGGVVLRGGADHTGTEFMARSCFLFSSILVPPLLSQDRSRMAVLELEPLATTAAAPELEPARLAEIGAALRARLVAGWPRFRQTLDDYRIALAEGGMGARGADQFGTLLACADLALNNFAPDAEDGGDLSQWAKKLIDGSGDEGGGGADHQRCASHLLTSVADVFRGGQRRTFASWIAEAGDVQVPPGKTACDQGGANDVLGTFGLKVVRIVDGDGGGGEDGEDAKAAWYLAVANDHRGLSGVFEGTHWAGRSGALPVFVQSLRRIKGARAHTSNLRFDGAPSRCTLVPLAELLPEDGAAGTP